MDDSKPLFETGQIVWTPGAQELFSRIEASPLDSVMRHVTGDWGDLGEEDKIANNEAIDAGVRIFSAYQLTKNEKIWIITEADRSSTTILLPSEY